MKIGIAGLGGYARFVRDLITGHKSHGIELECIYEPDLALHANVAAKLESDGVRITSSYRELLQRPIDAVWLPVPIQHHASYTIDALLAGKSVMCEKPAAGSVQDVDSMIAARDHSGLPAAIGFQDIYKPTTSLIKTALEQGGIGKITSAIVTACWPRDSQYYARSNWAGKIKVDGNWVLDSPANNALAHYMNLVFFLLGSGEESCSLTSVEAELYRVNDIESYDTCALRYGTSLDVTVGIYFTHACENSVEPQVLIRGETGSVIYNSNQTAVINTDSGSQTWSLISEDANNMLERFNNLVMGHNDERYVATLEVARTHTVGINGAAEASYIHDIADKYVRTIPNINGSQLTTIPGISDVFERCANEIVLPSELGDVPWSKKGGAMDLRGYNFFKGPK